MEEKVEQERIAKELAQKLATEAQKLADEAQKLADEAKEREAEAKERELAEEEALLKAMQRGELPQGDE